MYLTENNLSIAQDQNIDETASIDNMENQTSSTDNSLSTEQRQRATSLPQTSNNASFSTLNVDSNLNARISKSTECLSTEVQDPETSCMMVPESLSLEDIFAYNQRLSNPPEDKHRCSLKKKLSSHY